MRFISLFGRPFGVALGAFILINLAIALDNPAKATTEIWLNVHLSEPLQSVFAGVLGLALLVPHRAGGSPVARWLLCGIFSGFSVLVAASAVGFYRGIELGRFWSDFPIPLSGLVLVVLVAESARMWWWTAHPPRLPPPARLFVSAGAACLAFFLVTLTHIVSFGNTDFRCAADAAVVFGAKVGADGAPSSALRDRLDIAIGLYRDGLVDALIMTGGTDTYGNVEPAVMKSYAVAHDVPADAIFMDESGVNTIASARNCRAIAEREGFRGVLAVTQYFHCARVKLLFEREGLRCHTVPTSSSLSRTDGSQPVRLARERFFVLREVIAFPYYFIFYRG